MNLKFAQSSALYFNYSLSFAIKDLAKLGYDGIEIWGGRPHMYRQDLNKELEMIKMSLEETGLKVCNFIPAQFRYPSILCSNNQHIRRDSVQYICDAIDNAVAVRSPSVSLCPGMVLWDYSLKEGWDNLYNSLREIEDYCSDLPIRLLIEPAHKYESNLILTIEDCIEVLNSLNSDKFGILLDVGHCHVNNENLENSLKLCADYPLHIHIDDNSGESDSHLIPGEGTIDFNIFYQSLKDIGYSGFVSAELGTSYIMKPTEAAEKTLQFFKKYFVD
jgi:protein FrlC